MQECQNNPKILESLIQSGYDINTTNCYGTTALMFAAKVNSKTKKESVKNLDVTKDNP